MKKIICLFAATILFSINFSSLAAEGYKGYNYNSWGVSEPAPNAYETESVISASTLGITPFHAPCDMIYQNEKLYLLDSGNGRIVILDKNFKLIKVLNSFKDKDQNSVTLSNPKGLFVDQNERLVIADTDAGRVLISDSDGNVSSILKKPESDIFPDSIEFKPTRVLVDQQDNIYVLCNGFYYGAVMYDASGKFTGFFGSNRVEVSLSQLSDMFWRKFMTQTQKDYLSNYVPIDYTSFDIDFEDFIYTCSKSDGSLNEIKKLNSLGSNILEAEDSYDPLNKNDYGEREKIWYNGKYIDTVFVDIDVSDTGLINALDFTYGRVFQYDSDSNLLTSFGGLSDQEGMFKMPAAVESAGDKVLVLDSEKCSVTVFTPTEYGTLVHKATKLFNDGYYTEAMTEWQLLLRQNSNSELAYRGIGRAYLQQEDYKNALTYLRLGQDRAAYSKAFGFYRTALVKRNFPVVAVFIVILFFTLLFWGKLKALVRKKWGRKEKKPSPTVSPFSVLLHPMDQMEQLRSVKGYRQLILSAGILVLWFIVSIMERQGTGFIFNLNRPEGLDLLLMAAKTFGVFLLFTACSWAVGSFNEGEATFYKLINVTASAVFPYVLAVLFKTILSNLIVYEEYALVTAFTTLVLAYSVFLIMIGIMTAHQYTFGKTIWSLLLTAIVIVIVLFVLVLLFSLVQQLYIFILTIYNELMFRL